MSIVTIFDVAHAILDEYECNISTMSLQRLAYLAQGWHLGMYHEPFFEEDFEAWSSGPVSPQLHATYKGSSWINSEEFNHGDTTKLTHLQRALVKTVVNQYRHLNNGDLLMAVTYADNPCAKTEYKKVINKQSIERYYTKQLKDISH